MKGMPPMNKRAYLTTRTRTIALFVLCAALTTAAFANFAPTFAAVEDGSSDVIATVTTDRTDYNPGETVTITGSGFAAGETVSLEVLREGVQAATYQVTADENGNIYHSEFVIGADDVGASFTVKAKGDASGRTAESKFTDGTLSYTPASQNFTGASAVTSGASPVTVMFTQSVRSPADTAATFQANVAVSANSII